MTKKQISTYLGRLDWLFSVQHYKKDVLFMESPCADEPACTAEITTDHKYQELTIKIYPRFFKEKEESQKKILVHELCHVITTPQKQASYKLIDGELVIKDRIDEINETATSQIENIIWGFLNNKFNELKK